jgi:hypothetical protein
VVEERVLQTNGYGDLILKLRGDDADGINVLGDLHLVNGVLTTAISTMKFSDGTTLDMSHGPLIFTWIGTSAIRFRGPICDRIRSSSSATARSGS